MPADADADGAAAAAGRFRRRLSARGSWFFFLAFPFVASAFDSVFFFRFSPFFYSLKKIFFLLPGASGPPFRDGDVI